MSETDFVKTSNRICVLMMLFVINNVSANIKWSPSFISIFNESFLFDNLQETRPTVEGYYHFQNYRFYKTVNYNLMIHYNITTKTRIALSGGYAELVPSGRVVEAGFTDPVIAGSVQLTEKFFLIENISVPAGKESIGEQRMNVGSGIVMQFFSSPKQSLQFLFKINFLQIEQYNWQKKKHESAFIRSPYNALYYRRTFADITLFFNLILDGIRNNNYISFGINENCTCIKYFYPSISVGYNLDTLYYVCTLSMRF